MVLNRGKRGAVLLAVTWVLLILTGILLTLGYQAQLESLLYTQYKEELEIKTAARNLLQLVIHRLQHDDSDYDAPATEMAMIDAFNRNRRDAMYRAGLFELVGRLALPVFPDLAKLEPLITTEGFLNPNFISPRHLHAVIGAPPVNRVRLYELPAIQEAAPFTGWEYFAAYLKEVYGENYPAHVRLYFTFKTRIWGVRIRIMDESGANFCLTAVLERNREKAITPWAVKILSLQEEWEVTGEGGTGFVEEKSGRIGTTGRRLDHPGSGETRPRGSRRPGSGKLRPGEMGA